MAGYNWIHKDGDYVFGYGIAKEKFDGIKDIENKVEYLKTLPIFYSWSYGLQRYMFERYFERYEEETCGRRPGYAYLNFLSPKGDGAILELRVKNMNNENYRFDDVHDVERYACAYLYLTDQIHNDKTIKKARRKFKNDVIPHRAKLFEEAFNLGMTVEYTRMFIVNSSMEVGFRSRSYKEMIYYFCLKRLLRWREVQEIVKNYESYKDTTPTPSQKEGIKKYKLKEYTYSQIAMKMIDELEDLEHLFYFLKANKEAMDDCSRRARNAFRTAFENFSSYVFWKRGGWKEYLRGKAPSSGSGHKFFVQTENQSQKNIGFGNVTSEEFSRQFYEWLERGDKKYRELGRKFRILAPAKEVSEYILKNIGFDNVENSDMPYVIKSRKSYFGNSRWCRLLQNMNVTRFDLVLMLFLSKVGDRLMSEQNINEEELKKFMEDIDSILAECDFEPLHVCSPLDHLIILAYCHADPFGYLKGLLTDRA